jgi:5-methyltetrahydrofolate--homocysteine methyltransferase
MTESSKLYQAILEGDAKSAVAVTKDALASGADPLELVTQHMMTAMDEVGHRFETEEYFVPELLLAARAMKASLELLRPLLAAKGAQPVGRVVIGTVKGDLHDIGKNLVASMLEGAGFEVTDLGTDVAPERFVESAKALNADIVALSALLTVTMPSMRNVVKAIKQAGLNGRVKVMVGGAPVTRQYAEEIGADAYSENAAAAVATARKVMAIA